MINDKQNEFTIDQSSSARGQLITTTGAAAGATKVIDAGAAIDWGAGELVVPYAEIVTGAACDSATSVQIDIVASSTLALTGTALILSTRTILNAEYTGVATGKLFALPALLAGKGTRRYLGAIFTVTGNATTGAWVVGLRHKDAGAQSYGSSVSA